MRVIIAGSRGVDSLAHVSAAMVGAAMVGITPTCVVSGGARGVDRLGEQWAKANGLPVVVMHAEWEKHGRRAGFVRNQAMADFADALVAVWDGRSPGTRHMIDAAKRKQGMPVHVFTVPA